MIAQPATGPITAPAIQAWLAPPDSGDVLGESEADSESVPVPVPVLALESELVPERESDDPVVVAVAEAREVVIDGPGVRVVVLGSGKLVNGTNDH
jgi:hypothetical protein